MDYIIVVAKYNEDVTWLDAFHKKIIYDKSETPIPGAIRVENIGRESETFYRYIIENYDSLPEYIVFVQGDPFEHMTMINRLNFKMRIEELRPTKAIPLFTNIHEETIDHYKGIHFYEFYKLFIGEDVPDLIRYAYGCQYMVPRPVIRARPKEFYETLHGMICDLEYDEAHQGNHGMALTPWAVERLTPYIFNVVE